MAWDIGAFEYQSSDPVATDDSYTLTAGSVYNVSQANGVLDNDTYSCAEILAFYAAFLTAFDSWAKMTDLTLL